MKGISMSLPCILVVLITCMDVGNASKFTCNSGQQIRATRKCDGEPDCLDGSDEWAFACNQGLTYTSLLYFEQMT